MYTINNKVHLLKCTPCTTDYPRFSGTISGLTTFDTK